jgi:hypothetical protein
MSQLERKKVQTKALKMKPTHPLLGHLITGKERVLLMQVAARDEEEFERGDEHGDEAGHINEEDIFDVEEIIPQAYVHMGIPSFQQPQNHGWRQKVSYKGKAEAMREKRKENPRLKQREATDYRFHTFF